jgi:DNA polymerase III delta subunit
MITLLHGNYSESSRKEFIRLKEEAKMKDIRVLDGRTLDPASLTQAIESHSLFGGDTIIFIENLFGKLGRKTKLIESLAAIINESSADIILWEDKEAGITVLKNLSHAKVTLFKIPSVIFQLLDGIAPGAISRALPVYTTLSETEAPELIFAMIARRVRQLIQVANGVTPENLAGWQASRLTRQAKLFTIDRLLTMYKHLLDMEFSIKNGSSPFTLAQLTEQFIIDV